MASRFIRPDTDTLTISQGDTLVVKRRLNAGERRQMFAEMYRESLDGRLRFNPVTTGISRVLAYLVDWSLKDEGKPVVIRDQPTSVVAAALDGLDPDSFTEILAAIEAHEDRMTTAREQEKNGQDGATESSATSPSLK